MLKKSVWAGAVLALLAGSSVEAIAQGAPANPATGAASAVCERPSWSSRSRCTPEQFLLGRLSRDGLSTAMAVLDSLSQVDPEVRRLGHNFAHGMGLAAFSPTVEVGSILSQCTPIFQAGCHHGVIQAYFAYHGRMHGDHVDAATVNGLCEAVRADPSQRRLLFECTHGLGHGLMMVGNYNLPAVLETCDLLTDPWEQQVCYGASLMENIVHATAPHHNPGIAAPMTMVEAGASEAAHDHSAHAAAATTTPAAPTQFIALKKDEPFYPCTILRDRYVLACYQMQTSAILNLNGFDVPEAARICATAPALFISTCYQSLGRDISALTVQDNAKAMRLCGSAPAEYRAHCHLGYAKNLVDQTSRIEDGLAFCATLEAADSKRPCYSGMGEQAWSLYPAVDRREQICGAVESAYVTACRVGAGLDDRALRGPTTNPAAR